MDNLTEFKKIIIEHQNKSKDDVLKCILKFASKNKLTGITDPVLKEKRNHVDIISALKDLLMFAMENNITSIMGSRGDGLCIIYSLFATIKELFPQSFSNMLLTIAFRIESNNVIVDDRKFTVSDAFSCAFDYEFMAKGIYGLAIELWPQFNPNIDVNFFISSEAVDPLFFKPIMSILNVKNLVIYQAFNSYVSLDMGIVDETIRRYSNDRIDNENADLPTVYQVIIFSNSGEHYRATC